MLGKPVLQREVGDELPTLEVDRVAESQQGMDATWRREPRRPQRSRPGCVPRRTGSRRRLPEPRPTIPGTASGSTGLAGFHSTATRETFGAISLRSSSFLPAQFRTDVAQARDVATRT